MVPATAGKGATTVPALDQLPTTHPATEISKPSLGAYSGFTMDGKARPKVENSVTVVLDGNGTPSAVTKPLEIPKNTQWEKPETIVKAAPGSNAKGSGRTAVFSFAIDGDTFGFKSADGKKDDGYHWKNGEIRCRAETYNSDEVANKHKGTAAQPYGVESKQYVERLLQSGEVNVRVVRSAKNNERSICQIEVSGKNIDESILANGAGVLYERYAKDFLERAPMLRKIQEEAKAKKVGRWGNPNAFDPEAYQHGVRN